ncbi:MAG TPA: hypothetical protein ENN74_02870 [Firmicutes bacterium]|nr:hypothetical protein [Bacillota bacterium]
MAGGQGSKALFLWALSGMMAFLVGPLQAEVHNWAIELILTATQDSLVLSDIDNFAAVVEGASDGFDSRDACLDDPPPLGGDGASYLSLSFYHPEFEGLQEGVTSRCSADFHAPFEATGAWELLVETNLVDTELVLTWKWDSQGLGSVVPGEYRVFLLDEESGARVTLQEPGQPELEDSEYRIVSGTAPLERMLVLYVVNDPPPPPEGLQAFDGPQSILLRWDASSQPEDVEAFIIRYGTESGVYSAELVVGNVEEAMVEGLADETTYYFRVWARDRTGLESAPSEPEVSARAFLLGDLTSDGRVDWEDLFALSLHWHASDPQVDFNGDSTLDQEDLLLFRGNWHQER